MSRICTCTPRQRKPRRFEFQLTLEGRELVVPDMHLHAPAEEAGLPHALGHALTEHPVDDARVLVAAEVARRGRAVAYALDDRLVPCSGDGRAVIARGKVVEDEAPLAEETTQGQTLSR